MTATQADTRQTDTQQSSTGTRQARAKPAASGDDALLADAFNDASAFVRADDDAPPASPEALLTVTGRNVEVPEHYRVHVGDKLARVERFDHTISAFEVELFHERNRRQAKSCQRVEITVRRKGPKVRAEACADNFYAALETAVDKLQSRLRRTKDRRQVHHGLRTPISVAEATAEFDMPLIGMDTGQDMSAEAPDSDGPGHVVRTKEHSAQPMTVDDALYEMELVGHDFYLFHDSETDTPSVVYRRHAFDYGLIRLTG